jgi:L-iduronidase
MTAGIEDAEAYTGAKLFFGGTASGRASGDVYFLPAILEHKVSGKNAFNGNAVRLDYITAHVKGESTSYVTVQGEWKVSELIRSQTTWVTAGLGLLQVSNDEGDPMVGWEVPEDWRGDARYSSIIPKMVNQHLQCINDNSTQNNPLGLLSFDGAFINGVGDNYTGFGMRTMTTRFGSPKSRGPFAFVKKSGLAAFTLLSRLGDERCSYTGAPAGIDTMSENAGVLTTMRKATPFDAAQASILLYNSIDCEPDTTPLVLASVSISGLPFSSSPADGSVIAVMYSVDQMVLRNPAAMWAQRGSPIIPSSDDLTALWMSAANMTSPATSPFFIAVGTGGSITLPNVTLSLPSAVLWHIAEKATAPATPLAPVNVVAYFKNQNSSFVSNREVIVRWSCATASRVIGSYIIQVSPSGSNGLWKTIPSYANDITCSFVFNADETYAEGAQYRVAAVDYWSRQGPWSNIFNAILWPSFSNV